MIEYAGLLLDTDVKKCLVLYNAVHDTLVKRGEVIQPELYNNLAVMSLVNQNYAEAERHLDAAFKQIEKWQLITKDEESVREVKEKGFAAIFHFNKAVLYEETNRFEDCIKEYWKAIQVNPFFSDVYIRLALLAYKRGNIQ
jgi:tetratricopeptide (TPR) repeat protein